MEKFISGLFFLEREKEVEVEVFSVSFFFFFFSFFFFEWRSFVVLRSLFPSFRRSLSLSVLSLKETVTKSSVPVGWKEARAAKAQARKREAESKEALSGLSRAVEAKGEKKNESEISLAPALFLSLVRVRSLTLLPPSGYVSRASEVFECFKCLAWSRAGALRHELG